MTRRQFITSPPVLAAVASAPHARDYAANSPIDPAASAWDNAELRRVGIWDVHVHVNTPGSTPAGRMEALIAIADRVGVERMCIGMSRPWQHEATPEVFRASNNDVLAILQEWSSRAFGFVYLNPTYLRESLDELERCVANGPMIGIKLWVGARANSRQLDPIVERARELDAVILQHTFIKERGKSNLRFESTPQELAELSARHPGVPMVCGHTGGADWALGTRAIRARPELHAEFGGSDPVYGSIETAVRELGVNRVLFGSDASGRSFSSQIGRVLGADLSTHDKKLILRENLRRLLLPGLKRKGVHIPQ